MIKFIKNLYNEYIRKTHHQRQVELFMRLALQELPTTPTIPSLEVRKLRAKLILEEAFETVKALGFEIYTNKESLPLSEAGWNVFPQYEPNLEEIVDGCCDVKVVTTGTLSACGVPDDYFQNLVDDNNLAKFGPGHSIREDGKLIKPPGHKPPQIKEALELLKG